ncbi:MAG: hypothetical protein Q7V14_06000, partial [Coriobacteriia bacterium]|nr:hypothetical protein [Coriobacteriia bacterium]
LTLGGINLFGTFEPEPLPVWSDAPETTGTVPSTEPSSAEQTASPEVTATPDPADAPAGSKEGGTAANVVRKPFIAYRSAGALWIAAEDGAGARKLTAVNLGSFALSPDAGTLAYVDAAQSTLHVLDLPTGKDTRVGSAEDADLCWAPDSKYLLYTAKTATRFEARKVLRAGTGVAIIGAGHSPRSSPGGSGLAWVADAAFGQPGAASMALFASVGTVSRLAAPIASEVSFAVDGLVIAVGGAPGTARILTMTHDPKLVIDANSARELIGAPAGDRPVSYAHLCASPAQTDAAGSLAGGYLAYAQVGDDGYSRTYIYDSAKKRAVALSLRRDTYPLCWSADGTRLFIVEGNAFQGEPTSIVSVLPDGSGRKIVVENGGL